MNRPQRRARRTATFRAAGLALAGCALAFGGCVSPAGRESGRPSAVGLDTRPEGPAIAPLQAAPAGGTAAPMGPDRLALEFPAGDGKPAVTLSFPETDINDRLGLALDVRNTGTAPATLYADLNGDTWVRGTVTVPPGRTETLYVLERRRQLSPAAMALFPGMHGIPGGKMSLWAGIDEPIRARELKVFAVAPRTETKVEIANLRPFGSSALPDAAGFFPFIDRYGQYNHKDWPGKVHDDADLAAARRSEDADLAAHPPPADRDRFGGWAAGPQLAATGSFRVEKYEGQWWFVDPDGRLFWASGLDMVGFNASTTRTQGRERFFADPAPGGNFLARNLETKYGAGWRDAATERLLQRLPSWGLNTLGGGADRTIVAQHKVPYTLLLNSGRGAALDPHSPAWAEGMRRSLAAAAERIKDDPWCIGFFVDNEIHVSTDPAWWDSYYRQVAAAAKELIPGKLYLGSRLDYHDWPDVAPERHEIVRLAAKYCDVISFNFYKFTLDDFVLPPGVDRPAIVGEFHFGALDRGPFHTGLRSVVDQDHRAAAYRTFLTSALRRPAVAGALWFQCYDEAATGRFDGENYQIGFIDIADTPYAETVAAARAVNDRLYSLRRAAATAP